MQEGDRWCRKAVAGLGLVVTGVCWCRKVIAGAGRAVAGAGPAAAGAELVITAAGRSPVQGW